MAGQSNADPVDSKLSANKHGNKVLPFWSEFLENSGRGKDTKRKIYLPDNKPGGANDNF